MKELKVNRKPNAVFRNGNAAVISLPKLYLENSGVQIGDLVDLYVNEKDELIVRKHEGGKQK